MRYVRFVAVLAGFVVLLVHPADAQRMVHSGAEVGAMHSLLHRVAVVAQNGSAESGTATLQQTTDGLVVKIDLTGATGEQPAHIRKGTCADADASSAYLLTPLTDGKSTSTLSDPSIYSLMRGTYAIDVMASGDDHAQRVACSDLKLTK